MAAARERDPGSNWNSTPEWGGGAEQWPGSKEPGHCRFPCEWLRPARTRRIFLALRSTVLLQQSLQVRSCLKSAVAGAGGDFRILVESFGPGGAWTDRSQRSAVLAARPAVRRAGRPSGKMVAASVDLVNHATATACGRRRRGAHRRCRSGGLNIRAWRRSAASGRRNGRSGAPEPSGAKASETRRAGQAPERPAQRDQFAARQDARRNRCAARSLAPADSIDRPRLFAFGVVAVAFLRSRPLGRWVPPEDRGSG